MKRTAAIILLFAIFMTTLCSCGTQLAKGDPDCIHEYGEWQMMTRPTEDAKGERIRGCSLCGHVDREELDALAYVPEEWAATLDRVLADRRNPCADIYNISYATAEDRRTRTGTSALAEGQFCSNTTNGWLTYGAIPELTVKIFLEAIDPDFFDRTEADDTRITVTSLLIKSLMGSVEMSKEALTAVEREYDRQDLMELFLNTVRFSAKIYGINSAAHSYFAKDVGELDIAETALIATLPTLGAEYDPVTYSDANKVQREAVLLSLKDKAVISEDDYNTAMAKVFTFTSAPEQVYSWYTKTVKEDAVSLIGTTLGVDWMTAEDRLYSEGYKIYTVMDTDVQSMMETFFAEPSNFTSISGGIQPQCGMVIADPATGDILGVVGGRGEKTDNLGKDHATRETHCPGSTIKPVGVYGPSLEYGMIHYSTIVEDSPYNGDWPSNYPEGYRGPTPVYDAVTRSVNTIAVKLLMNLTGTRSYEFVHDKLGMHSVVKSETRASGQVVSDLNASALALGGMLHGVTVRELTGAYQIFANAGVFTGNRTILKIEDRLGNVIVDNEGTPSQVITPENASIMTKMLEAVVDRGTASTMTLDDKVNCAGKTGTTSYDMDRWFVGYTPYYLGGVWFGYEYDKSLAGFSEIRSPAIDVWDKMMTVIHDSKVLSEGVIPDDFVMSEGVIVKDICSATGMLVSPGCGDYATKGYYAEGNMPTEQCTRHQ